MTPTHEQLKAAYTKLTHLISNVEWDNCFDFMYNAALEKIPKPKFNPGDIVMSNDREVEIMVSDELSQDEDSFSGIVMRSPFNPKGHYSRAWNIIEFTRKSTI